MIHQIQHFLKINLYIVYTNQQALIVRGLQHKCKTATYIGGITVRTVCILHCNLHVLA